MGRRICVTSARWAALGAAWAASRPHAPAVAPGCVRHAAGMCAEALFSEGKITPTLGCGCAPRPALGGVRRAVATRRIA